MIILNKGGDKYSALLGECFGIHKSEIPKYVYNYGTQRYEDFEIICRPSQFARFIILRNEVGFTNKIKELDARLFIPVEKPQKVEPIEVWDR